MRTSACCPSVEEDFHLVELPQGIRLRRPCPRFATTARGGGGGAGSATLGHAARGVIITSISNFINIIVLLFVLLFLIVYLYVKVGTNAVTGYKALITCIKGYEGYSG
jgi:hypothetical protein